MWRTVLAVPLCAAGVDGLIIQGSSSSADDIPSFESFVQMQGRSYTSGSAEYEHRRGHYQRRAAEAAVQNAKRNRRWTAGVNEYWDWSEDEFAMLRGYRRGASSSSSTGRRGGGGGDGLQLWQSSEGEATAIPAEKRWTNLSATTNIFKQGGCGSCWAVAAATVLQAHTELHTSYKTRTFSPQELVSCVPNPQQCGGAGGCKGATVELAMDWVMENGLAEEYQVPYAAKDLHCGKTPIIQVLSAGHNEQKTSFGMTGWTKLPENRYEPLLKALAEKGPVAVSAAASKWGSYKKGIFDGCVKDAVVDHAITAVGYGVDASSGDKYWIIQNSWGKFWGEKGYIRILRHDGDDDYCGTNNHPEMGTGCIGGPKEVKVCGMCGILYDSVVPLF